MPKIIENLKTRLIEEAGRQIGESGYSSMTIRSVASACGIGIGTVYHYYPSKDALVAAFLLQDWKECVRVITSVSEYSDSPDTVVRCVYDQLCGFGARHQAIFRDESAAASFSGSFGKYHCRLRSQISGPLQKFCRDSFTADFIAESLLTWTMAGMDFDRIFGVISRLF